MEISVEKITLKLGKKTIELSVEDARKLKDALDSVLGGCVYTYAYPNTWTSKTVDTTPTVTWSNTSATVKSATIKI